MKRLLLLLILVPSLLYAEHNWAAIKFGYGNETAGIGLAAEAKLRDFGLVLGVGIPDNKIGVSATTKYYFSTEEELSFFITVGYGMLGFMFVDIDIGVFETAYVYGPYIMVGSSTVWGDLFGDYSLGVGYSFADFNLVLTAQASLGFTFLQF